MKGGITKMTYVTKLRGADLTPGEYLVLMTIWTYTDERMQNAWPGRDRLQTDTGMSREGVRLALRSLEEKGFIILTAKGGYRGKQKMADVYSLSLPTQLAEDANSVGMDLPTQWPPSDPSHQIHTSDPSSTDDPGGSSQMSSTTDPDGSVQTPGAKHDPISPAFHHSQDRKFLLQAVKVIAQNRTEGDYEKLEINLDHLLLALNTFFDRDDEYLWGADYGWEDIPKKCTDPYEAGKWLNTYLNAWQNEEGPLDWTPYNWEAAA